MEDVLDLYSEAPDPRRPVVCFDETPVQLIGETRIPWPAQPGKPARIDYEYRRNGTANLFVFLDAHQPWRHVKVTERKTAHDFAQYMYELAEVHYREAETLRVVLDNLSAHKPSALYEVYGPELARDVLRRLEFHFVPKQRVGSIWWKLKSAYWVSSAWTGALKTATPCAVNWRIGSGDATPKGLGSSGCSMSIAPARNWLESIPRQSPLASIRLPEPVKITVRGY